MVSRRSTYSSPSGHVIHLLASTSRGTMRLPLINSKFQLIWPRSGTRRMKPLILSAFRRFPSWRRSSDTKLFGKRIRWTSDAPLFWRFIMLFAFTFTRPAPQIFNQSSCQHPATAAKVYFLFRHFSEILGYNDTTRWNGPIRDALIWGRTGRRTKRKKKQKCLHFDSPVAFFNQRPNPPGWMHSVKRWFPWKIIAFWEEKLFICAGARLRQGCILVVSYSQLIKKVNIHI